jgi:hypothetical protein
MARQAIDNGSWFDIDKATKFDGNTYHNGRNQISVNTNSQWEHQDLYRTAKGSWIFNDYSSYQGTRESWELTDEQSAVDWLIRNAHEIPDDLKHLESTNEV